MLVLTRKPDESIIIDENIEVIVLETKGDQVRLGIKAPSSVKIYRKEVWDSIKEQNISSSGISDENLELLSKKVKKTKS